MNKHKLLIAMLTLLSVFDIHPAFADGFYLTNNIPQVSRWHHEMGITCNGEYGAFLFMVLESETQFNDWQTMAVQMDYDRRDYACNIMARPSDIMGDPFIVVGQVSFVMNQDFSGARLVSASAMPGYQIEITKGALGSTSPDIGIAITNSK
jgi:hypothetical protein